MTVRSSEFRLVTQIDAAFTARLGESQAYLDLQILLNNPGKASAETLDLLCRHLPEMEKNAFEQCLTEDLAPLLSLLSEEEEGKLATVIATRLYKEGDLRRAAYYAALTSDHPRLAGILLSFATKNVAAEFRAKFAEAKTEAEHIALVKELEVRARSLLLFCSDPTHFEEIKDLFPIAQEAVRGLNPAPRQNVLSAAQPILAWGRTLPNGQLHKPITAIYREKREAFLQGFSSQKSAEEMQQRQSDVIDTFFAFLLDDATALLGPPPCGFALCAMGSLGRREPTPLSDIEPLMLIEKAECKPYFETLCQLLDLQLVSLGETPISGSPPFSKAKKGLFWDAGTQLTIGTPGEALREIQGGQLDVASLTYTAHHLRFVCGNQPNLLTTLLKDFPSFRDQASSLIDAKLELGMPSLPRETAPFSFKESFFVPLYLIQDLAIHLGLSETNPIAIAKKLARTFLTVESAAYVENSLAFLYIFRCTHPDAVSPLDPAMEELRRIHRRLIVPLFDAMQKRRLAGGEDAKPIDLFTHSLQSLIDNEAAPADVEEFSRDLQVLGATAGLLISCYETLSTHGVSIEPLREAFLRHVRGPIREELAMMPNPFGERQIIRIRRNAFRENLTQLTSREVEVNAHGFSVEIQTESGITAFLKRDVLDAILDRAGDLERKCADTRSRVVPYSDGNVSFHFKQAPTNPKKESPFHPGREWAASELMLRLFGRGAAVGELAQFAVRSAKGEKRYLVYISETIPGPTLKEAKDPRPDPKQLTEQFLAIPLLLPGDGRGANMIFEEETGHIVQIDQDVSWVYPMERRGSKLNVHLYTVLPFYFPRYPLDQDVIDAFLQIRPSLFLLSWAEALIRYNDNIRSQFRGFLRGPTTPEVLLEQGMGAQVYAQLCSMQAFFEKHRGETLHGPNIMETIIANNAKGQLTDLGPFLFRAYQLAAKNPRLSIEDRAKSVTRRPIANNSDESISHTKSTLVLYRTLPTTESKRELCDPQYMREEIEGFIVLKMRDIFFSQAEDGLTTLSTGFVQIENPTNERNMLDALVVHRYRELNLSHCSVLTDDLLLPFLTQSGSSLESLNLSHCSGITAKSLAAISRLCPNLYELFVSYTNIAYCADVRLGSRSLRRLPFPQLEHLHISHCPQLKILFLASPNLNVLKADNNPNLVRYDLKTRFTAAIDTAESGKQYQGNYYGIERYKKDYGYELWAPPLDWDRVEMLLKEPCPMHPSKTIGDTHFLALLNWNGCGRWSLITKKASINLPRFSNAYRAANSSEVSSAMQIMGLLGLRKRYVFQLPSISNLFSEFGRAINRINRYRTIAPFNYKNPPSIRTTFTHECAFPGFENRIYNLFIEAIAPCFEGEARRSLEECWKSGDIDQLSTWVEENLANLNKIKNLTFRGVASFPEEILDDENHEAREYLPEGMSVESFEWYPYRHISVPDQFFGPLSSVKRLLLNRSVLLSIPGWVCQFKALEVLDIRGSCVPLYSIPEELSSLPALRKIIVRPGQIMCDIPKGLSEIIVEEPL